MNRLKQLKTYPFGLFFSLEWIFLGASIFGELPDEFLEEQQYGSLPDSSSFTFSLFFTLLCLIGLGLMGLKLPENNNNNNFNKWLYTLLQLGLLWLPLISTSNTINYFVPYLIITIRSCLIFEIRERILATILIVMVSTVLRAIYSSGFQESQARATKRLAMTLPEFNVMHNIETIGFLFNFGLCSVVVLILVNALIKECESRQQLVLAHQKLREYAILVEDRATLDERNRIAREIHDSLGHTLTAQNIQLNNAIAFWQTQPDRAYQFLTEAQELIATAIKEIRYSINTLRGDPLKGKSLESAIALLFQEFSSRTKIIPNYTIALNHSLSKEIKLTVYRIIQEALTNIVKHSDAKVVKVELQTLPEDLSLSIKDNGKGFSPQLNTTGFGLQGMRERVIALKGKMEISSSLQRGCIITINIPIQTLSK